MQSRDAAADKFANDSRALFVALQGGPTWKLTWEHMHGPVSRFRLLVSLSSRNELARVVQKCAAEQGYCSSRLIIPSREFAKCLEHILSCCWPGCWFTAVPACLGMTYKAGDVVTGCRRRGVLDPYKLTMFRAPRILQMLFERYISTPGGLFRGELPMGPIAEFVTEGYLSIEDASYI